MGRNVPLKITPQILVGLATLYTDVHRIFMEYIDNSIDSAEDFFDGKSNSYKKNIEINFDLVGDQIIASDNCSGISNFDKVVQSVGESDKKKKTWTNGQFGFGVYAFMATCEKLQITSKEESASEANSVTLLRKDFAEKDIDNISYNIKNVKFDRPSGTVIKLSGFDKKKFKSFDITKIKDEIEKHFELLLKRKGLSIKLNDKNKSLSYQCNSFDYLQYEGDNYVQSIDNLEIKDGRRSGITKITLPTPINIFLRVTRGKVIGKPPVFIAKSRRINEVNQMNCIGN